MAAERTSEETKTTLFQVMANIKPGGQKWSVKNSYPARRPSFGKCERCHTFWNFNCIFRYFTAFPSPWPLILNQSK